MVREYLPQSYTNSSLAFEYSLHFTKSRTGWHTQPMFVSHPPSRSDVNSTPVSPRPLSPPGLAFPITYSFQGDGERESPVSIYYYPSLKRKPCWLSRTRLWWLWPVHMSPVVCSYIRNFIPVNRDEKVAKRMEYKWKMAPRELISIVPLASRDENISTAHDWTVV